MMLERESPPRSLILGNPLTCLSLATCRPNSFGHWGGSFSRLWTDIQTLAFSENPHSPSVCGTAGEPPPPTGRHPSRACLGIHPPSLSLPSFLPGAPHVLLLGTSFMTAFVAPHFPYVLLMNTFGTLTNRVLGPSPYWFASVKLVCRWRGGGGEASQVRYLGFPCRAGVTKDPEASVSLGA